MRCAEGIPVSTNWQPCVCVGRVEGKEENNRCCVDKYTARYRVKFVDEMLSEKGVAVDWSKSITGRAFHNFITLLK